MNVIPFFIARAALLLTNFKNRMVGHELLNRVQIIQTSECHKSLLRLLEKTMVQTIDHCVQKSDLRLFLKRPKTFCQTS